MPTDLLSHRVPWESPPSRARALLRAASPAYRSLDGVHLVSGGSPWCDHRAGARGGAGRHPAPGLRPHAEIIGEVAKSSPPASIAARWRSISASVASPEA